MVNVSTVIEHLKKDRARLEDQLHRITAALTAFGQVYVNGTDLTTKRRTMSTSARKKISIAQEERWAKSAVSGQDFAMKPKRKKLSAAAKKKIGDAQRARWAKLKKNSKAA
jgi:hypothetical protein